MPALKNNDGTIKYFDDLGGAGRHYKTCEAGIKVFVGQPPSLTQPPNLLPLKQIFPQTILECVKKAMGHTQACWSEDQRQWWNNWADNVPQDLEAVRFMRDDHCGEGVAVSKIPNWEWPLPCSDVDTAPQPPALPQAPLPTVEPVTFDNSFSHDQANDPQHETPSTSAAAADLNPLPDAAALQVAAASEPASTFNVSSFTLADRARATRNAERIVDENQIMELDEGDMIIVTQAPNMDGAVCCSNDYCPFVC